MAGHILGCVKQSCCSSGNCHRYAQLSDNHIQDSKEMRTLLKEGLWVLSKGESLAEMDDTNY